LLPPSNYAHSNKLWADMQMLQPTLTELLEEFVK
jgi:hypothetical protein